MDKYQRRNISRWEQKKVKNNERLERKVRKQFNIDAMEEISTFMKTYTPDRSQFSLKEMLTTAPHDMLMGGFEELGWHGGWWMPVHYEERSLQRVIDVPASLLAVKRLKDRCGKINYSAEVRRHCARTETIQSELLESANKFRAIQNCRNGFKEELMQKAWHPRRMERLLETYGWEAYDNLLGVE